MNILSTLLMADTPRGRVITSIDEHEIVSQKMVVQLGGYQKQAATPGTPMPLDNFIELIKQAKEPTRQSVLQKINAVIIPQKAGAEKESWLKVAQEITKVAREIMVKELIQEHQTVCEREVELRKRLEEELQVARAKPELESFERERAEWEQSEKQLQEEKAQLKEENILDGI